MSKTIEKAKSFLQKANQPRSDFVEGFQSRAVSPSISIPLTIELTEAERSEIRTLLESHPKSGFSEGEIRNHAEQLASITGQIKSISAQSVLLHGERIKQAKELLSGYGEGTFTQWLMTAYGNRQTPYSMLRYYEFYQSAPDQFRKVIESTPKKAVYLLASRNGSVKEKLELLIKNKDATQTELTRRIQTAYPTKETDKRKPSNTPTINAMMKLCQRLEGKSLTRDDRTAINKLIVKLQQL